MGKSIRSKRQKRLRTIKRDALGPSEALKVTHLNAKLQAYIKRSHDLDTLDSDSATKDEHDAASAAIDPILLPTPNKGFVHPHPKPRDPADPTIRPYPRGQPREAGRISFQQAVDRERRAMEGTEEEEEEGKQAEGGEADGAAQVKVETQSGRDRVQSVSMLSDDEEGNPAEISYVPLGQPARAKRANKHKGKTTGRGGKKLSRSAAVVANWKRLGGGRNGLVS